MPNIPKGVSLLQSDYPPTDPIEIKVYQSAEDIAFILYKNFYNFFTIVQDFILILRKASLNPNNKHKYYQRITQQIQKLKFNSKNNQQDIQIIDNLFNNSYALCTAVCHYDILRGHIIEAFVQCHYDRKFKYPNSLYNLSL